MTTGNVRTLKTGRASDAFCASGALVAGASVAAQQGSPHIESPVDYDAIVLIGFGGPEAQEDVLPFLRNVTFGRGIPDERLEEVATHYRHFGGVSPINEQNRVLRAALEAELKNSGHDLPVYWGNRNWAPFLDDTLTGMFSDGKRLVLALATSAYSSFSSCRQYREDIADAVEAAGLSGKIQIDKVRQFFDHPGFVDSFVSATREAFESFASDDSGGKTEVLFVTHSIPCADADASGPTDAGFGSGGAYVAQHRAVAHAVIEALGDDELSWQLVYQSRSGPPHVPWLEPDVNDAIRLLPERGVSRVVIVPIGFLSDHMEVLWDLDEEAVATAKECGLRVARAATPGASAVFVSGLVDLISERIGGRQLEKRETATEIGPWFDVCRPGCCENKRVGFRPAYAGVLP